MMMIELPNGLLLLDWPVIWLSLFFFFLTSNYSCWKLLPIKSIIMILYYY